MIAITGATGQVGGAVLRRLVGTDVPVRALARGPRKAQALRQSGVQAVAGDFAEPEALDRAFEGADTVFLACANGPDQVELESGAVEAAVRAGVRRVVKLSVHGAEAGSPVPFHDWHGRIEEGLKDSGVGFTLLRPNFFMQGLPALLAPDGNIHAPTGDGRVGWVDVGDIAEVAARTLTEEGHGGKAYTITGPESLPLAEVADELSGAAGREIRHVDIAPEAARKGMTSSGMPKWFAEALLALFAFGREGGLDVVTTPYPPWGGSSHVLSSPTPANSLRRSTADRGNPGPSRPGYAAPIRRIGGSGSFRMLNLASPGAWSPIASCPGRRLPARKPTPARASRNLVSCCRRCAAGF